VRREFSRPATVGWRLLALVATAAFAMCLAGVATAAAEGTINTIAVGDNPQAVASDGTHAWVANASSDDVTEIEASTGAVVRTIKVGSEPRSVAADGTHVWVANEAGANVSGKSVSEIEASTGTVTRTIKIAEKELRFLSSDGTYVWGTSTFGEGLMRIDIASGTVAYFSLGFRPWGAVSDGTHVWVADWLKNRVSERDASTNAVIQSIPTAATPKGVSFDGAHVWVAEESPQGFVQEIDPSSGTVIATVSGLPVEPEQISSDGTHVWAASRGGQLGEIDAASATLINTLDTGARASGGVADVSSDGTNVWETSPLTDKVARVPVGFTAECASNTGTIKLSPGIRETPAVQTVKLKGVLSGCEGEGFTEVTYKATIKTSVAASCSSLKEPSTPSGGSGKFKWNPKKAWATPGVLSLALTEMPGAVFSGETESFRGGWNLTLAGSVDEHFENAENCASKALKKGTLTGSGVALNSHS
jgi:YVTN family beta-propeller protein